MSLFDDRDMFDGDPDWPSKTDPCPICGYSLAGHTQEDNDRCVEAFHENELFIHKIIDEHLKKKT